jgi:hypothetical protein
MKTKCFLARNVVAFSIGALVVGVTMQAPAQSETFLKSTIVRLKGNARCSTDGGKTWRMVKAGDTLDSGALIQTAKKSDMDLALGGGTEAQPDNLVSLAEDTLLQLDKVVRKRAAVSPGTLEEISLDLRMGAITGNVRTLASGSTYEISFPNGVAGTRAGIYTLRANGELSVSKGKAFIALADGRPAKEISAGQQFNPASGVAAALPPQATRPPVESQPAAVTRAEPSSSSVPPARETSSPKKRVPPPSTGLRRAGQ